MSELCLSATSRAQLFFTHLLSDLYLFFSFIISHPLYFFYFIFFSPYLLKLLSFLSPLFFTTSLLFISLVFTNFIPRDHNFSSQKSMGFLTKAYNAIVNIVRYKVSDYDKTSGHEYLRFEDSEVFKIVFDTPTVNDYNEINTQVEEETFFQALEEEEGSEFSGLIPQESEECASGLRGISVEEQKTEPVTSSKPEKVAEMSLVGNGSEAEGNKIIQNNVGVLNIEKSTQLIGRESVPVKLCRCHSEGFGPENMQLVSSVKQCLCYSEKLVRENVQLVPSVKECRCHSERLDISGELKVESSRTLDYKLGCYGSTRKEKEWKRTLACKLFEERHNVVDHGGEEGMDLLWETYEAESSKSKMKSINMSKKKDKKKYREAKSRDGEEGTDDQDEEDESDGQLCCLQALKFSAGKINLGMGKPSLVKITKAVKGFGWLHQMSSRRSKKVHNGDKFF